MDIELLKTFIVLSNVKNYTRAANQLFVAQSTVTNRINELEKELNISLFSRNNRRVELTMEGEQFLLYAEKVIKLTDDLLSEISSIHKFDNHIRIGCSDSVYEAHLSSIILEHQRKFPKDSLKIMIGISNNLLELLQDDILDIVFSYIPLKKAAFYCEMYKQDTMVLVTDYNNKKYKEGITQKELVNEKYLMCNFALQDVGQFIRGLFPKYQQFSLEIDDCAKIIPFLLGQENYTFLPWDMAKSYIESGKLRNIPLIDFKTPMINSYIIGKKEKQYMRKIIMGE